MAVIRKPSWMTWGDVARRTWAKVTDEDVTGRAAELAYYFFLALFPLLICVLQIFAIVPAAALHLRELLLQFVGRVLPYAASELITTTMDEIQRGTSGTQITLGALAYLWSASAGMMAVIEAINSAYHIKDTRSYLKQRGLAIALTTGTGLLLATVSSFLVVGSDLVSDTGPQALALKALEWLLAAACVLFSLAVIYYFAPDVAERSWRWITPGAVAALAVWLIASLGFRVYLHFFDSYSATYGSLGAAIILLLWFYLAGIALILGAQINFILESAGAEQGRDTERLGRHAPQHAASR
jgi:membrane protein